MSRLPPQPGEGATKADYARWLGAFGQATKAFKVFPCEPNAKTPRAGFKWKEGASWDVKTIDAWWTDGEFNIGLAIQPGFVALDADIYKAGNEALLNTFETDYGKLPETLEFESANGGRHLIYSTTRLLGNSTGTLPKFGDVRGFGGYIVGPGSSIDGKPYTVGFPDLPVPLPPHVDARLVAKRSDTAATKELPPTKLLDDPINVARYTVWLLTNASVGRMGTRNNTLAATAAMGASYGLSEDETVHLILEHWNKRECLDAEPFDEEKLDRHARSGYRSSTSTFGNMALDNPKLMGFTDQTKGVANSDPLWRTMADILGPAPPRLWALGTDADGWVPLGGVTLLYGAGGTGKTALVGQWALAQARGEPLFGLPTRQMPVVLVAAEDSAEEMHRRFEAQGRRAGDDVSFAAVRGMDTALHPSFKKEGGEDTWLYSLIEHKLASMPAGPKLLFLDNLGQLYQGNYTEQAEIMRFINKYLGRLAEQHEATIVVLAHPSESQRASGDGGMGGVGWSAGVRARLYFERHMTRATKTEKAKQIGRERVFSRKKANYADDGERDILLDWNNWTFVPVEHKAAHPFSPVVEAPEQPKVRRNSVAEGAVLPIVQKAVEEALACNPSKRWTALELATDASYRLGSGPNKLVPDTIRKIYLPQLIANAHPGYDNLVRQWRHATIH